MRGATFARGLWITLIAGSLLLCGCGKSDDSLPTVYGKRTGRNAASVNGTKVLSEMFRESGFHVRSFKNLAPSTMRYDVIVWVPNSSHGPTPEMRSKILHWLDEGEGRTFIYIGREYDASMQYWQEVANKLPEEERFDAARQKALATQQFDESRSGLVDTEDFQWFQFERFETPRKVNQLSGPWSKNVKNKKTDIILSSKLVAPDPNKIYDEIIDNGDPAYAIEEMETLLDSDQGPIVIRLGNEYNESSAIIINNGSFLLNLPLVNPEHRKLAGQLVEECQTYYGGTKVAFLETDGLPRILDADDSSRGTSGWEWLENWPINLVGFQLAWWLIILCFAMFPIFGRPRSLPRPSSSDFKKHIDSVGELLEDTKDTQYAQERVQQYQQIMKGEAVYRRSKSRY